MSKTIRFGVSLEEALLDNFDRLIKSRKYTNRSEAIRDLIRQELLNKDLEEDREVAGAITFIYDHHQRNLLNKIIDIQHDHHDIIQSSQHIHLDALRDVVSFSIHKLSSSNDVVSVSSDQTLSSSP